MTIQFLYKHCMRRAYPTVNASPLSLHLGETFHFNAHGASRSCSSTSYLRSCSLFVLDHVSFPLVQLVPYDLDAVAPLLGPFPIIGFSPHARMAQSDDSSSPLVYLTRRAADQLSPHHQPRLADRQIANSKPHPGNE